MLRIGLISDTHDLLRPEAVEFLAGSDHIVHAGDICSPAVLAALAELAPVTAVRGNNDRGDWAQDLSDIERLEVGGQVLLVIHDLAGLDEAELDGVTVVVSGHSHKPAVYEREGRWFVNPGSAGRRRFSLPISVGEILIDATGLRLRTHTLPV